MEVAVRLDPAGSLAEQIYRQLRDAVLDGRLRREEALPSSRDLAGQLKVSRNTVTAAYERLIAEGYLVGRGGAGTFVNAMPVALPDAPQLPSGSLVPRAVWPRMPIPPDYSETPEFDFRVGAPDTRLFPYTAWRRLLTSQFRQSAVGTGMPVEPAGHLGLRTLLAGHLRTARTIETHPRDVLITSGAQQALDLIGRVLLEPGATAVVEEPGYAPPKLVWEAQGATVIGVPVDEQGLIVEALPPGARVVYVTPSHQYPTGVAMTLRRRVELLAWAQRHDAAIVEDDYDSEFRYTEQQLEPLHSLDRSGRVLYIGSFSKVLLPTLRLGYLIHPTSLRHALHAAKFLADWHTSLPPQAAMADFLAQGLYARHLRRVRRVYRQRHDRITAALAGPLAAHLTVVPSSAGLHLSALPRGAPTDDVLTRARAAGLGLASYPEIAAAAPGQPGIVLGYGMIDAHRITEGLTRLRQCLDAC
ncbi:GntR family transcriptional regulator [Paractinoplanes abujensis]|uniref:GntR family transcriptional regulator/MocR family aminotransferase n=1 Tax=Paractinoplanes abujensis TaxID=882441 RepID=A0A7W7CN77_9ACTN|nr:PLP-dependent aminotransferase family protein [Actinoplanes abujensis]MBB4691679.1 GntR family transcriptional regulator/MocR family aminotransferase [Actinoplanes abujensis]GID16900.1 GntR family transcriptional regulator [Actinoplanes abujensis]